MSKKVLSPNVPPFIPKNYAFPVESLESCCGSSFNAHRTSDCQPHCSHKSMYCSTEQQEICASSQVIEPKFQVPHVTEMKAEPRRGPVLSHNYTQWFSHESGKEAPFIKQYLSEKKSSYLKDKNIPIDAVTFRDMFSSNKSVCQEEMSNQKASKFESEASSSKYITSCSTRPAEKCYLQNKPTNFYDSCKNLDLSGEIASDTMPQNKKFINNMDDFPCLPCSPSKPWLKNSQKPDMTKNNTDIAYSEKLKSVYHVPSNKLGCDNVNNSIKTENDKSKKNNSLFSVKQHYLQSKKSESPCRNYSSVCSTVSIESSKLQFDYVSDKRCDFKSDRKIPVKNDAFLEQPKGEKIYENHSDRKFGKSIKYHYSIEKNNGNVSYSSKSNIKNGIKSSSTTSKIHTEATRNDHTSILNRSNPISNHNIKEKTKDMKKLDKAKDIKNNDKTILNNTSEISNLGSIQKSSTGRKLRMKENTLVKESKESPKLQAAESMNLNKINDEVTSTRKKKKRKSQLKRQTAFQMGKVTVVSPEVHSRITGNLTYNNSNYYSNIHVDVANPDEYPELGQVQHKENKTAIKYSKRKPKEIAINHHKDSVNSSMKANINPKDNSTEKSSIEKLLHLFKYSDALKTSKPELRVKQLNRKCSEEITNNMSSGANNISEVETLLDNAANFLANLKGPEHHALEVKRFGAKERYHDSCRKEEEKQKRNATRTRKSLETSESKMKHSSDAPLEISFCDILTNSNVKIKNIQREIRNRVISTKRSKLNRDLHGPHNLLDSSSPLKKRGKERETPKKKKKSALKKIILLERKEKKANRSLLKDKSKEVGSLVESISINTERLNTVEENKFGVQSETKLSANEINEESSLSAPTVQKSTNNEEMINQMLMKKDIPEVQDSEINAECLQGNKDNTSNSSLMALSGENRLRAVQLILHTNNFREYCNHLISEELDTVVLTLLSDLARFQDRMYQKDPVKARMKRRLVYGLKEVTKHLKLRKLKCIIIAPDVENIKAQGGLNDALANIVHLANESHIPCVFALRKKSLGKACIKPVPVSCVGIFNYEGSEANFRKLVELHADSKKAYDVMVNNIEENLSESVVKKLLEAETTSHLALHSLRTEFLRQIFVSKTPAEALTVKPKVTKKYVDEISGCSSEVVI